jgi:hypothetical protein
MDSKNNERLCGLEEYLHVPTISHVALKLNEEYAGWTHSETFDDFSAIDSVHLSFR